MGRWVIPTVLPVLAASLWLGGEEQVAQADTPGCVTKHEYQHVQRGDRVKRVHRIFDTRGWFIDGGAGGFARGYRFCPRAAQLAGTGSFPVIYVVRDDWSKRLWRKYCGPSFAQRRPCF